MPSSDESQPSPPPSPSVSSLAETKPSGAPSLEPNKSCVPSSELGVLPGDSISAPSSEPSAEDPLIGDSDPVDWSGDTVGQGGNNRSNEERVDLWKKRGSCVRCGLIRTHARPKACASGVPQLPLEPITVDGEVYKGYHLSCFGGLGIVMDYLGENSQARGPNNRTHQGDQFSSLEMSLDYDSAATVLDGVSPRYDAELVGTSQVVGGEDRAIAAYKPTPPQPMFNDHDFEGPRYDKLTVFQAAPLVWRESCTDEDGGSEYHAIEMLDFDREREVLETSLADARPLGAEIGLVFETATTDRLGAFLATSDAQVLHFTCHGAPEYLCMEDGSGGAHLLMVDELRELMSSASGSDGNLQFVFVSACYSRAAGEAFLKAGVPHVVCCQQDEPIMDGATIEFSRNFYLALACGRQLQEAFNLARQCVMASPSVPNAANEMRKFLLLPEDADHNVQVFFTKRRHRSVGSSIESSSPSSPWILPASPQVFMGREIEMYKILCTLRLSRLVRLKGGPGMGKSSLAAAVARYVSSRGRNFSVDEIIWLPLMHAGRGDGISSSFQELFAILEGWRPAVDLYGDSDYMRVCGSIVEYLHQRKALIVIEAKTFLELHEMDKLSIFLQDLFRGTRYVRVILVCQDGLDVMLHNSCVQSEVVVDALSFRDTASLFGRICHHVSDRRCSKVCTPRQLATLLVPKDKGDVKLHSHQRRLLSQRCIEIFGRIGGGIPAMIHKAAMMMAPKEYDELIAIAERLEYSADCKTRVELEQQLSELNEELQVAVREKNFTRAKEIQAALDELERLREILPTLDELRRTAETLTRDLDRAVSLKVYTEAEALSEQLDGVNAQIKVEEEAVSEDDTNPSAKGEDLRRAKRRHSTRAGLEMEMRSKRDKLKESIKTRDFTSCRIIQSELDDLETHRQSLPSRSEISLKIASLNSDLEKTVRAKDFAAAESTHREIEQLEEQSKLEEESEGNFVSSTAMWVGKHLIALGEELDKAVLDHDIPRAKEIENNIHEEVKQLEWKFTLDYGLQRNQDEGGDDGADDGRPTRDRRPGASSKGARRRAGDDDDLLKQKKEATDAPGSGSRQDGIYTLNETRKETLASSNSEHNARAAETQGVTKPGAVAIAGPNAPSTVLAPSGSSNSVESRSDRDERLRFEARWAQAQRRLRYSRLSEAECEQSDFADSFLHQAQREDLPTVSSPPRDRPSSGRGPSDSPPGRGQRPRSSMGNAPDNAGTPFDRSLIERHQESMGGRGAGPSGGGRYRVGTGHNDGIGQAAARYQESMGGRGAGHSDLGRYQAGTGHNDGIGHASAPGSLALQVLDSLDNSTDGDHAQGQGQGDGLELYRPNAPADHDELISSLQQGTNTDMQSAHIEHTLPSGVPGAFNVPGGAFTDDERGPLDPPDEEEPALLRAAPSMPMASPVEAVTQEDAIERIVRDVMARDTVEATGVVVETSQPRSRRLLSKRLGKFVKKVPGLRGVGVIFPGVSRLNECKE